MSQFNIQSSESMTTLYRNQKHIHNQSLSLAGEQLDFLNGVALGDVDIFVESGETRRKVRRIIEKRVCQEMHRKGKSSASNWGRYQGKRRVANQFKNIFGGYPSSMVA